MRNKIVYCLIVAIATMAACLSIDAYAVSPGFYMGLMLGPATNSGGAQEAQVEGAPLTTPVTPRSNQFGTRIFLGNQLNNYFSFEGGLAYFSQINFDTKGVETCSPPKVQVTSFDIVGKGAYPFWYVDVYAKAGVAIAREYVSGSLNPDLTSDCGESTAEFKFRPTVSLGASYQLSQNWVTDLSWNRVMAGGKASNIDFIALGIAYHFVNIYCGQFLCDD